MTLGIDEQGRLPLPWLQQPLQQALARQRGHALLLHAAPGIGALQFVLCLAQSMLCEAPAARQPAATALACGHCTGCHLFQAHVHPDLMVILPEALRRQHQWPMLGDKAEGDDGKRKPSRQIRIDEIRAMRDWAAKTSARGHGKVAVLHPAPAMNLQAANALLKTLEEPPLGTRLLLTAADPAWLLPTVRSRCQSLRLAAPAADAAFRWLMEQQPGLTHTEATQMLAASGGQVLDAAALLQAGINATQWADLPRAVVQMRFNAFASWSVPQVVDTLQKICHDALATQLGAPPRFFASASLPARADRAALSAWAQSLARVARHDEHPWNEALMIEALVTAGARALSSPGPRHRAGAPALDTLRT